MAYRGKQVTVPSLSHLMDEVKDLLLAAGWTLQGPSTNPSFHNDPRGFILGWFLHSTGESGTDDINMHLYHNVKTADTTLPATAYLTADIGASDTTIPVSNGSLFMTNSIIRLDNEMILVGGVSSNNLTSCTRGLGDTDNVAHTADYTGVGNVVLQLYKPTGTPEYGYPCIEMFMYADYTTPIHSSSESASMDVDGPATFASLGGLGTNKIAQHTMVKVSGGSENGKMRFITSYNTSTGAISYQPFLSSPGTVSCDVISQGFGACAWKYHPTATTKGMGAIAGNLYITATPGQNFTAYIYASKDGGCIFVQQGTPPASCFFTHFGKPKLIYPEPNYETTQDVAKGATEIYVNDVSTFKANTKFRIVAQSTDDWLNNRVPGSGWPDLDPIEWVSEELMISAVDPGTKKLTLSFGTNWSYKTGAVIGILPRWFFRGHYTTNAWGNIMPTYWWSENAVITSHASHRGAFRAIHTSADVKAPYAQDATHGTRNCNCFSWLSFTICPENTVDRVIQQNRQQWCFHPLLVCQPTNTTTVGAFYGDAGNLQHIKAMNWYNNTPPSGWTHGTMMKMMFQGKYQNFRLVTQGSPANWYLLGPEIEP